jgi:hypothetical protein
MHYGYDTAKKSVKHGQELALEIDTSTRLSSVAPKSLAVLYSGRSSRLLAFAYLPIRDRDQET